MIKPLCLPLTALRRALILLSLGAILIASPPARAADDVVLMRNGDRMSGEIKSLERGLLNFKTDATDTIGIKWDYVVGLLSSQNFDITLDDGRRTLAKIAHGSGAAGIRLETGLTPLDVPIGSVVRMVPVEGRLIDRIDMSIDVGYDRAKANGLARTNLSYELGYRSERRVIDLNIDVAESASQSAPSSKRAYGTFSYLHLLERHKWDPIALSTIEHNDELGLDRRVTLGGGMSKWIKDTGSSRMSFTGGLVYTSEDEVDAPATKDGVEAAIGLNLDWFRYEDPELDVSMRFSAYRRLSDEHRTRGNLDVNLRWELINDFFWGFSIYYSFNSAPVGIISSDTDYGVATSLGWSF